MENFEIRTYGRTELALTQFAPFVSFTFWIKNGIEPLFPYFPLMHQHFHQCPFGTVRVRNP